jgi:hypothetical protein
MLFISAPPPATHSQHGCGTSFAAALPCVSQPTPARSNILETCAPGAYRVEEQNAMTHYISVLDGSGAVWGV